MGKICIAIQTGARIHFCLHRNDMRRKYCIAGRVLAVRTDFDVAGNEKDIDKFRVLSGKTDFAVDFEKTEKLPALTGQDISADLDSRISVHIESGRIVQAFHEGICGEIFAQASIDYRERTQKICYLERGLRQFRNIRQCFDWMGIENIYAGLETVILHAALIDLAGEGILFMGPSGIGKSTRAELWRRYAGADILNGDRAFVNRGMNGEWIGYGSPYAGSSGYYINRKTSLRCIVAVRRGGSEEVSIRRLAGSQSFKEVYKNITACRWNTQAVNMVTETALGMIWEIPVYELVCPPDIRAVQILRKELGMGQ